MREIEKQQQRETIAIYFKTIAVDTLIICLILLLFNALFNFEYAVLLGISFLIALINIGTFPVFRKKKDYEQNK